MIVPSVKYGLNLNDTNHVKSFVSLAFRKQHSLPCVQANDEWYFSSKL